MLALILAEFMDEACRASGWDVEKNDGLRFIFCVNI
jgi:hypothetical protein